MAHDYAKRPRNGRKKKKAISSGPIWLGTGLLCGFFLAFLLQLAGFNLAPNNAAPAEHVPTPIADATPTTNEQQQAQTAKKPRFEFYALLPEAEVEVAEDAEVPVADSSSSTAATNTHQSPPLASTRQTVPANGTQYVLQAGSFKSHDDADRLRARLLLMGLEANIEQVKLSRTDSRHRVQVGPFDTRSDMASARELMTDAKIDTLLLERKGR